MQDSGLDQFRIDWADDGGSHVVAIHGEVDLATADALREAFARAAASGAPEIVVDLGFCRFMDSAGIAALLSLNRRLAGSIGRDLVILPGPPAVQRTFAICDLLDVLPFHDAVATASSLAATAEAG